MTLINSDKAAYRLPATSKAGRSRTDDPRTSLTLSLAGHIETARRHGYVAPVLLHKSTKHIYLSLSTCTTNFGPFF
jgi:hypothetical protein